MPSFFQIHDMKILQLKQYEAQVIRRAVAVPNKIRAVKVLQQHSNGTTYESNFSIRFEFAVRSTDSAHSSTLA